MTGTPESGPGGPRNDDGDAWTVLRLMRWSGTYLEGKGVERGRLDAEHLLAHALGVGRLQLYLQFDRPLEPEELDLFRPLLKRRAEREPLQYIVGRAGFRELDLRVDRHVLIPRPETEVLVDEVLAWAGATGRADLTAMDLGTGTGAIALSLVLEGPFARVVATDTSTGALAVARANAADVEAGVRVEFREGSLYTPLSPGERFDAIVSNPPYVAETEAGSLEPEVGVWEPAGALFGGADGLDVLLGIVTDAPAHLCPGGVLALEVGAGQPRAVVALLEETGEFEEVRVRRDLAGRERVVLARKPGPASIESDE